MYTIKESPADFIVNEVSSITLEEDGEWTYWQLKKENLNTLSAMGMIADALNLPIKYIGCAGNKDKVAITTQTISIRGRPKEVIEKLSLKDITLTFLGRGSIPISIGNLKGNEFIITIRNIDKLNDNAEFLNLFGEQRFGGNNVEVGKAILKKEYKHACELLALPTKNPVESLKTIKKNLLKLYIHAVQSHIWNELAGRLEKKNIKIETLPIPGFGSTFENEEVKAIIKELLKEEGLTLRDFIIRPIPEASAEGNEREMYVKAENLEIKKIENGFITSFFLPKGCYATVFLASLARH